MQRECGRLIRQRVARKGWHLSLERNMLDDGFRVFQDVSTLEDVFRFHKQNNRAIYRPWWEMCTSDPRNGMSFLVHASRKDARVARVAVLSCEAHVDNRILDIQREKDLMEVSWLGWSMLKLLIRFFNVFFPVWCRNFRRVCAESWMMLSANRKLSRLFLCAFHSLVAVLFFIQQGKVLSQRLLNRAGEACSGTARRVERTRSRGGLFCSWWKEWQCISYHLISWLARQRCRTAWEGLCKPLFDANGTSRWAASFCFATGKKLRPSNGELRAELATRLTLLIPWW